uniref:Methyltransferase type 12 n=1 Tax=Solibacter usitatus (strain Ellin6076) TaxID=234267 RepID=Q01XL4_SOLUE
MRCRVCAADPVTEIGAVEYYSGYCWKIFDCLVCLCRFTTHDQSTYDWLHSHANSVYSIYRTLADKATQLFENGDIAGLREELVKSPKYRFIIESVERQTKSARLLEIGCSRGYLTSYFIMNGYQIVGTDVSAEAVAVANESFGPHFMTAGSKEIQNRAPYDVIYHVGTIGCVQDPLGLTRELLALLRPGGQLLFNAPNVESCYLSGQLWTDDAPPPDVVTLFRPGVWRRYFSGLADVLEEVEMSPSDEAFRIWLRKTWAREWRSPLPLPLDESADTYRRGRPDNDGASQNFWRTLERVALAVARRARLLGFVPCQPRPFGLFVTMIKKD